MLEQQTLLVQRSPSGWSVLDPASRRLLGVARWRPAIGLLGGHWLARPVLEVFEAQDEPLVFRVRKLWALSTKWEVSDADANRVAVLRGGWLSDVLGRPFAFMERTNQGIRIQRNGRELAATIDAGDEATLAFAPELQIQPLVKMALLGALLVSWV
jgi:hypothetical protein